MGKHKIKIKKIEDKHQRQICFTKRRKGLFKKAAKLCKLGCECSIIVISPAQNGFSYAQPDLNMVVDGFIDKNRVHQHALITQPQAAEGHQSAAAAAAEEEVEELEDDEMTISMTYTEDDGEPLEKGEVSSKPSKGKELKSPSEEEEEEDSDVKSSAGGLEVASAPAFEGVFRNVAYWLNKSLEGLSVNEMKEMESVLVEMRGTAMKFWEELPPKKANLCLFPTSPLGRGDTAAAAAATTAAASTSTARPLDPVSPPADLDLELRLGI